MYSGEYVVYKLGDYNSPKKMRREWKNSDFNFDDVPQGMLTLFTVATFEGWPGFVTSFSFIITLCLSVCLSVCLLSVCLSVCLSVSLKPFVS